MSRVYFHSPSDEAEIRGSERALLSHYVNRALLAGLGLDRPVDTAYEEEDARAVLSMLVNPTYDVPPRFLATHLSVAGDEEQFELAGGVRVGVWCTALNTLLATGSDPMILSARLHGQCEIHAYVEGPNRAWLADIMEQGRAAAVFRPDAGWESVVSLLRRRDDEPVVMSDSSAESFPMVPSLYADDEEWVEAWYQLPETEQWRQALEALRAGSWGLEMTPEHWTWPAFHFGDHLVTAYHVGEQAKSRVRRWDPFGGVA